MSYGILINNANNNVQIDSTTTARGVIVTDTGTGNNAGYVDIKKELIFAKPNSGSGNQHIGARLGAVQSNGTQYMEFRNDNGNTVSCDFIKCVVSDELTQSSSGYGVQIFNSDGDLAYDTGQYTGDGGIGITDFAAAFSLDGDYEQFDTDTSKFGFMNNTYQNTDFFIGYFYVNNASGTNKVATNGLYYHGLLRFSLGYFGGQENFTEINVTNLGALFLAEGGSV